MVSCFYETISRIFTIDLIFVNTKAILGLIQIGQYSTWVYIFSCKSCASQNLQVKRDRVNVRGKENSCLHTLFTCLQIERFREESKPTHPPIHQIFKPINNILIPSKISKPTQNMAPNPSPFSATACTHLLWIAVLSYPCSMYYSLVHSLQGNVLTVQTHTLNTHTHKQILSLWTALLS